MAAVLKFNMKFLNNKIFVGFEKFKLPCLQPNCKISTSTTNFLKEIHQIEDGNQITIEGVPVKSDRTGKVVRTPTERGKCPLCRVGITHLKHTDVLILSQFINSDGTVIPPFITGLCARQHTRVMRAVVLAQKAGLIPKQPGTPIFGEWEKYNTYFKRF